MLREENYYSYEKNFCVTADVDVKFDQRLIDQGQQASPAFEIGYSISTELFWSNLEQITVAPNGGAGCLLPGDKSLSAGSSGPAAFHPAIA